MSVNYISLAKHCIGLDRKEPYVRHGKRFYRPYRNYFSTGPDLENWEIMVISGYARRRRAEISTAVIHSI